MRYYHILWEFDDDNPNDPKVLLVTEKSGIDDYLFTPEQRRVDDEHDGAMMDRIFKSPSDADAIEKIRAYCRRGDR